MADENQENPQSETGLPVQTDPNFFTCVNEFLEVTHRQTQLYSDKRISMTSLFAAARFNTHVFLSSIDASRVPGERTEFLDYMTQLYRRMLNEHLDGLGQERNIDVGESELAEEYAAAGLKVGRMAANTPANEYVSASGAVPPAASATE
ncbi:MAG: DUF3144 domain-containing protein [Thermomonas sp.]